MAKRERTPSATDDAKKRTRVTKPETFKPIKVASVDAADATDANPPFKQLIQELENTVRNPINGDYILYWMRMTDLRRTCSLWSELFSYALLTLQYSV